MAGGDRISDLPDDLLHRILYFAPVKEAASTSALARRWRSLWLSSGAVNLDTRSYHVPDDNLYGKRATFVRDAHAALDARDRHCPLRKLTFHVEGHGWDTIQVFLCISDDGLKDDIVGFVLSHRAARSVEELCVDAYVGRHPYEDRCESGYYDLSLASLPSMNLRRLRISSCASLKVLPASAPVAFPRLEELRLHFCTDVPLQDLQIVVDSAPHLAVLELHSVCLSSSENDVPGDAATHDGSPPPAKLRCAAVTALVMSDCTWTNWTGVELDAPMLRCFKYNGNFREPFALKPQEAANLTRVDMEYFSPDMYYYIENNTCACFWQCAASFSNARVLKLKTNQLEHLRHGPELNKMPFRDLERLELEAQYKPGRSKHTGAAIAHLLHCCPVIRELRLNLSTSTASEIKSYGYDGCYEQDVLAEKDQLDFNKSVNHFLRRRFKNPTMSCEVPDYIHGLTGQSFTCLQTSLRCVSLRFRRDESNRFGVRLAKFLAENALVLEEMHIDDGNQKIWEHINHVVGRSIAGSASGFVVLPLETRK
ncbi:hypothetical protein CFC21_043363 [Triticum aestivum]|uniref:F-box domain-containing protein n=2 Tax=Triticum aestivum TaxID=4565 RepID=A0A9R1JWG1_WHEAT|nr:hypothetical protein CFC21_043363 [Triticum aestivum]CDM85508.1 unnamed protein product [Triticum aestivum]